MTSSIFEEIKTLDKTEVFMIKRKCTLMLDKNEEKIIIKSLAIYFGI